MFQKISLSASCLLVMMLFGGCSKEQSSLSIEDIPGKTLITGNLSYSKGQSFQIGEIVEKIEPAANKRVFIEVSNASLSPTGAAQGSTTFSGLTDNSGNFSIEVPAVSKPEGTTVTIKPETFAGEQVLLHFNDQDQLTSETSKVTYSHPGRTITVKPNETVICDMTYSSTEREIGAVLKESVDLSIKIGVGKLRKNTSHYDSNEAYIDTEAGISLTASVSYYDENRGEEIKRIYRGITDKDGAVFFKIPVREKTCSLAVELNAASFATDKFLFYTGYEAIYYSGLYKQYNNGVLDRPVNFESLLFNETNNFHVNLKSILIFEQNEGQPYGYNYKQYNWSTLTF